MAAFTTNLTYAIERSKYMLVARLLCVYHEVQIY